MAIASSLTACAGDRDAEQQFIASCKSQSIGVKKCKCMLDVYQEAGVDLGKMSDPNDSVAEAQKIKPEMVQKLAQCALK